MIRLHRQALVGLLLSMTACGGASAPEKLSVAVIGDPPVLTPPSQRAPGPASRTLLSSMAEGLVRFDFNGLVEPGLAKRWIVIDDGRTYIFRLRRVEFAPGRRIIADDVAKILKAAVVARTNRVADDLAVIDEINALTPEIIEITLKAQRPDLLQLLAQPEMAVIAGRYGGGPFSLKSNPRQTILLTPKPDQEPEPDDDDEAPVNLRGISAPAAIARFNLGLDDLVLRGTFNELPYVQSAKISSDRIKFDPALGIFGLRVLRRDGLLKSAEMRRALSMAISRNQITSDFETPKWATQQTLYPSATRNLAPVQFGFATFTEEQRRTAATQIVRESGKGQRRLTVALPDGPGSRLLFARLQHDLARVGIKLERVDANAQPELILADRVADSTDPAWFIREAAGCWLSPCTEEVSMALKEMESQPTLAGWTAARERAEIAVMTDVPFIPIAAPLRFQLVADGLHGFQTNEHATHPLNKLLRAPTSTK